VRLGAPVVVLVLQNGMYGTIAMHQARDLGRTSGVDIGSVDLVRWAEGLGAAAYGVAEAAELDDALHGAVTGGRPAVVAVRTDPEIITPTATLAGLLERVPV
jgi:acetolactate synthase I/II/III large subunit